MTKTARPCFSPPGEYEVGLKVQDDEDNWSAKEECTVRIVVVGLGVSTGYVAVNNDDDNANEKPDYHSTEQTVTGENDLLAIYLDYEPSSLAPGYIELKIAYSDDDIKVWSDSGKGSLIIPNGRFLEKYYKRWPVGSQPSTLAVEGCSAGTAELWLLYSNSTDPEAPVYPGGDDNHDPVNFTVVAVHQVWINYAGSSWENVTGDTIVVLKGTEYTFKAYPDPSSASWPSGRPNWSGVASGTGATIDVTFDTAGTNTLTAKCGADDTGKTVTIKVVVPEPDQVSFVDYSLDEEHTIYGVPDPVWKRVSNPDNPASYTQDSHIKTQACFWASDSLTYWTQVDVDVEGSGSFTFTEDTGVSFGTWPSETTSHSSDGKIANSIGSTDFTFTWKYRPSGTSTWITMANTTGPHSIYRVFDAPECGSSNYTKDNIDDAISKASGETTEADIASKANDNVGDTVFYDPGGNCMCSAGFQVHFDAAMDEYPSSPPKGQCCCRAKGLGCVLQVLGIGPYEQDFVNECDEPNTQRECIYEECSICNDDVVRHYWDGDYWNAWLGVVKKQN
ncbi:MAG: hypothetical protein PVJ86_14735, partial [Phycisphaerales bacterium]